MKAYHLTIIKNGVYHTLFTKVTCLESYLAVANENGDKVDIICSRELNEIEWERVVDLGLYKGGHQPMN